MKVAVSILAGLQISVLVLFLRCCSAGRGSFHEDARALISLKSGVVDGLSSLDSWRESANYSAGQHCSWVGVQCDRSNRVVALDISNMNLSGIVAPAVGRLQSLVNLTVAANNFWGIFPSEIGNLAGLRSLNISNNFFNGSLPRGLFGLKALEVLDAYNNNLTGELPVELSAMAARLRYLNLGGNYFSGGIPPEYGRLKKLEYLALCGNGLGGRIPAELGNLERLEQLYLGYFNSFDGGIPSRFGNLTSLVHLDMASCGLEGEIPPELGNLRRLDTIYFQENALSGPIPPQLGNLASLKSLDLSNNELAGEIPEQFAELKELRLLNLFMNRLHGGIPSFTGDLPNLEVLQLWKNNFTGGLPRQLGRNGRLIELDVSSNKLTGFIPPDLCAGGRLQILIILDNFFFGPVPESLGACKSLVRVRMGQNYLNGSIPRGLLYLPALALIELQYNYLSGSIPEESPSGTVPSKLGQMTLSYNRLGGTLPPSIGNFSALQILLINGNDFTGSIPQEIGRLGSISKLDFSRNGFSARIPAEISRCRLLTYLDLSQNQLSGPMPVEIAGMPILNYLNVSRNRLSGSIPREFENMQSLTAVDFSFNNLSGAVPESGQFAYFNATSFAGNPALCGPYVISCSNASGNSNNNNNNNNCDTAGPVSSPLKMVLAIGLVFCSLIFAIGAIIKARNLRKAGSANSWKLTAFQRLEFASEDVLECLKEDNIIGKGGAGIVYRGLMPNGEEVAVKRLMGRTSSHDHGFSAEIQTLGRIRHRHIVRLLAFCSNHDTNLLVYEYMPNGSLGELLHGNKGGHLHWNTRFKIATEAAKGLCYLHHDCSPLIVHRDVKSNNILLDSNFEAHVADFGLAKFLQDSGSSECMSSIAGSYGYIAPEYAYTLKVDEKSDVYSFGVVLLELITGKRPVGDFGDGVDLVQWVKKMTGGSKEAVTKILDRRLASVPLEEAMHIFSVALRCVAEHSVERPTMREVVQLFADAPKSKSTHHYFSPSAQPKPAESKKPLSVPPPYLLCI